MPDFGCMVVVPTDPDGSRVAAAAACAGGIGVLDVTGALDLVLARRAASSLARLGAGRLAGLRIDPLDDAQVALLDALEPTDGVALLAPTDAVDLPDAIRRTREHCSHVFLEVVDLDQVATVDDIDIDGLVANGNEAGGEVSDQTSLVLLQRLLVATSLPVWVRGGVGIHSAAACFVVGAAGVVLDTQLALIRESTLDSELQALVACSDGASTVVLGDELGLPVRVFNRPRLGPVAELAELAGMLAARRDHAARTEWRAAVRARTGWRDLHTLAVPMGEEAGLAGALTREFPSTRQLVRGIVDHAREHASEAARQRALRAGSSLAVDHDTEFPVVQGPMTRVSDSPELLLATAEAGGLPFLALALADADRSVDLMRRTGQLLEGRSWGVGVLGFVPAEVRAGQLEAIRQHPPTFALVAGGRPDQAHELGAAGITTYLHVPSPALLRLFLAEGCRSFVFEGRECGGHVGPRSSLVLWDQAVQVLLEEDLDDLSDCRLLFAGGVHDDVTAAAVAALAAPVVAKGARIGVLMGTAYLFTDEAVRTGAITPTFQEVAVDCDKTVLLETGPGHATRCALSPYTITFAAARKAERERVLDGRQTAEAARDRLESLNLGRLRVATRGMAHVQQGEATQPIGAEGQLAEGMFMIGDTATLRDGRCTMRELHHTVCHGSQRRLDLFGAEAPARAIRRDEPIAILGMSCLLPGSPDISSYWRTLLGERDVIREIPKDRWRIADYYDPDPAAPDKIYSRWGGFLDDVVIDPLRYGIPPVAVPSIEPMQLLALHVSEAALADAGCLGAEVDHSRTSVIFGVGGGIADLGQRYAVRSGLPMLLDGPTDDAYARLPAWTEDSFAGILLNVVAGRVANRFNLGGINLAVDAACASSLAAVQLAQRELRSGTCDLVVVGGADTVQNPFGYLCFSKTRALSPRGRCHSFDADADGIVISEGLAVVVLKRLSDAERDGNRIYATIAGVGSSSDGRGTSLTAPSVSGQETALLRAYSDAGFPPSSVGLVEAHGTGTVAGDRTEVAALKRVFAGSGSDCVALGSVKSMIGHTKCAAGLAGLVKATLALHERVLPATVNVTTPLQDLTTAETPLYLNTRTRPWIHTAPAPRRAGVSSFGFGGVNVHALLEEYSGPTPDLLPAPWPVQLFLLASDSWPSLTERLRHLDREVTTEGALSALAASTQDEAATRIADDAELIRCAIVAPDATSLRARIHALLDVIDRGQTGPWHDPRGCFAAQVASIGPEQTAFLVPGQGSQYPDMMRHLAVLVPSFRDSLEKSERALLGRLDRPLSSYIFPPPRFDADASSADASALTDTEVAQPALGAVAIATAALLGTFGVQPGMVAGHSYGEYVALGVAGVLDHTTLIKLSHARGRCIRKAATPGSMVVVAGSLALVESTLGRLPGWTVANLNSPTQTVLSGPTGSMPEAIETLTGAGVSARALPVACGFHSDLVRPAATALVDVLAGVPMHPATMPVYANTTAAPYPSDSPGIRALLGRHLVEPVRFDAEVRAMYDAGARVFVEVGPKAVLTGLVDDILRGRDHVAIATDPPSGGASGFLLSLGRMFVAGLPVDARDLGANPAPAATPGRTAWLVDGGRSAPITPDNAPAPDRTLSNPNAREQVVTRP